MTFDPNTLHQLLTRPESERLDFKREWYDLDSKRGKAEFAKDVLAMANAVREGQTGYIVIGVDDPTRGQEVIGVADYPEPDTLSHILSMHTRPMPVLHPHLQIGLDNKKVSVLEIEWSPYQPHYTTRDVDGVLSSDRVYTRHGATVGTLTPPELETLFRAKDARLGRPSGAGPLLVGIVELPYRAGGEITVRVTNVTDEPVESIWASYDVILIHHPHAVYRGGLINNLALDPGESREFSFRRTDSHFYESDGTPIRPEGKIWSKWLDVRLYVTYRDRDGFIQQIVRELSLGH